MTLAIINSDATDKKDVSKTLMISIAYLRLQLSPHGAEHASLLDIFQWGRCGYGAKQEYFVPGASVMPLASASSEAVTNR